MLKIVNYNNHLEISLKTEIMNHIIKSLSKQEGLNFCWDARFLNLFFKFESAACYKKPASQQTFGPFYFVRALTDPFS